MDEELHDVKKYIASKNELLLAARIDSETNPQDPTARARVKHFENEVAHLEDRYKTLVTALANVPAPTQGTFNSKGLILEALTLPTKLAVKLYLKDEFVLENDQLQFEEGEVTLKLSEFQTLEAACILVKVRANLDCTPVLYTLEKGSRTFIRDISSLLSAAKNRKILFASTTRFTPSTSRVSLDTGNTKLNELWTIHPEIQSNIWKSVVRIATEESVGTGFVVDTDEDSIYIMTNLHLIIQDTDFISPDFQKQISRYMKLNPHVKKSAKRKVESIDAPEVTISQLLDGTLKVVGKFILHPDICWYAIADFDYLIWKVPFPFFPNCSLQKCEFSRSLVYDSKSVHIFGFPGALEGSQFQHAHAVIPAQITGYDNEYHYLLSTLSTPGLSGSSIVCTQRGTPIGYLGGGFVTDMGNQQYESYGYSFVVLPKDLPSNLKR